jgi:hypothetical protein
MNNGDWNNQSCRHAQAVPRMSGNKSAVSDGTAFCRGREIVPALFAAGHTGQTCSLRRVRQGMRGEGIRHDEPQTG